MSEKLIMRLNRDIDTLKKLEEMYMENARPSRRFMEVRNALKIAIIVLTEKKERHEKSEKESQVVRTPEEIAKLLLQEVSCNTCEQMAGKCAGLHKPCNGYNRWIDWLTKKEVDE